ncbi:vestitone reductase-like isoform X2 [Apium graveolens]|uniref:vestitone reductase-like isoform X2 n=1 Tax=Apium graveolens TaxID=4045 RepID=UPI003D7913D0
MEKGVVCVTGGTGYVASWLIMRLLQQGYAVNTTVRSHPDQKKDVSYLTNLPGASERLRIFNADLDRPESFSDSIQGCVGVFHVAHNIDFEGKEDEETNTKKSIDATISILQACLDSKTVKRVVYTSSGSTVMYSGKDLSVLDETTWTDVDYLKSRKTLGESYYISKTSTERAALEFAETHGLELVTVIPTFIHGPFITPHCPGSVHTLMTMIFAVDITLEEFPRFLSQRYPEYNVSSNSFLKNVKESKIFKLSSKKLLDTGFKYKYGLEQMYDDAIDCCKQKGLL